MLSDDEAARSAISQVYVLFAELGSVRLGRTRTACEVLTAGAADFQSPAFEYRRSP